VIFLLANLFFMLLVIWVIHLSNFSLDLFQKPLDITRLLVRMGNIYITILALCSFQFWLGLCFRNFIIPTAVGFALWLAGMMMTFEFKSKLIDFFPYSFQTFAFMPNAQLKMTQVVWTSLGYTALFLLLGFLDFRRRRLAA
ncbi:MAG TPA: hypothetical protein VFR58_01045, partial [Flavisolibacter sp.]|nr:hypothetical protein [Flavisolibacter sp.]